MFKIDHLFRKDNFVSAGDNVEVIYRGQRYIGKVNHINHKKNKYVMTIKLRFLDESPVVVRQRHQISIIKDIESWEP